MVELCSSSNLSQKPYYYCRVFLPRPIIEFTTEDLKFVHAYSKSLNLVHTINSKLSDHTRSAKNLNIIAMGAEFSVSLLCASSN